MLPQKISAGPGFWSQLNAAARLAKSYAEPPLVSWAPSNAGPGPMASCYLTSPLTWSPSSSLAIFRSSWVIDYLPIPCPRKPDPLVVAFLVFKFNENSGSSPHIAWFSAHILPTSSCPPVDNLPDSLEPEQILKFPRSINLIHSE